MKKRVYLVLILIFIVFAYLRFSNLQNRVIFDWDQEHYAYEIKNIVQNHKLTLIGPRANNDKGFFLGPYFTYLMIPFYLLTNLHPNGSLYFLIVYNLVFYFLSFFIIKKFFGSKPALLFLFIWTINNLLAGYDVIPWWPVLIPLGVILVWKFLFQRNWLFLGLTLGFFTNIHFQFIFLFFFSVVFILLASNKKQELRWKQIALTVTGFLITLLPLIFFDLRHNFLNLKLLINFFTPGKGQIASDYFAWTPVFTNFLQPLIYLKSEVLMTIFFLIFAVVAFHLYKKSKKELKTFYLSMLILWLITPLFFAFYGKRPSEYYYVFLYPFITITMVNFLLSFKNKNLERGLIILVLGYLMIANWPLLKNNLGNNDYGLANKNQVIQEIKKNTTAEKISIIYNVPLGRDNGFKYLIEYYGMKDEGGPKFEIVIPADNQCKFKAGIIGLKYE